MKLGELRNYIDETAWDKQTIYFLDTDEPEFSTCGYDMITGDTELSYGFFDRITGITLFFEPCDSNGIYLTRYCLLEWLDSLVSEHGANIPVRIRLFENGRGIHYRDMFTDKMWGNITIASDGGYKLTDGGSKQIHPIQHNDFEQWMLDRASF